MFGKVFVVFQELFVVFADMGHRIIMLMIISTDKNNDNETEFNLRINLITDNNIIMIMIVTLSFVLVSHFLPKFWAIKHSYKLCVLFVWNSIWSIFFLL